jgi:hypothetical protein
MLFTFTAYSESLILLLAIGRYVLLRRGNWVWAGMVAALAALGRQTELALIVPMMREWWRVSLRGLTQGARGTPGATDAGRVQGLRLSDLAPRLEATPQNRLRGFLYELSPSPLPKQRWAPPCSISGGLRVIR